MEVINMDPAVKVELKKLISAKLCSSVIGQVCCQIINRLQCTVILIYNELVELKACMDAVVNAPKENEPSYKLFMQVKRFFQILVDC
jgi:hypothetical protein